jgi:hypothetical protein
MTVEEIHEDDIGTKFLLTVKDGTSAVDISSATTKQIIFEKPDGTTLTKDATFDSDGSDGKIYYESISGDLDTAGTWTIQAKVILPTGTWKSNKETFAVHSNIE